MIFNRSQYFNLTDIRKTYRIPTKIKDLSSWLQTQGITPVLTRQINLGTYEVTAAYFDPKQVEALGLPKKKNKV